jgi:hypothetical protein
MKRIYDDTGRTTSVPETRQEVLQGARLIEDAWSWYMMNGYLPHEAANYIIELVVSLRCETALTNSLKAYRAGKDK